MVQCIEEHVPRQWLTETPSPDEFARMLDMTIVTEIIGEAAHELLQVMKQNAIQHKAIDFVKGSSVPAVTEQRTLIEFMRKFCTTVGLTDALGKYSAGSETNVHRGQEPLVIRTPH